MTPVNDYILLEEQGQVGTLVMPPSQKKSSGIVFAIPEECKTPVKIGDIVQYEEGREVPVEQDGKRYKAIQSKNIIVIL